MRYLLLGAIALGAGAQAQVPAHGGVRLSRAIGIVESHVSGRAIEADVQKRGGRLVYEIDVVRGPILHRALVDIQSGKLISVTRPRLENWTLPWLDPERLREGARAVPLAERLELLEERNHGEVRDVDFAVEHGRGVFEIEFATAAGIGKVRIDGVSGKRLELAESD
ncbi:PepSY domain-containing protein [Sphingomonas sp.]|uniref:PepSY domain-containing protein n=1 Tax=Sphingomonas sp. TaxID=28214 RepID=UPI003B3ADAF4